MKQINFVVLICLSLLIAGCSASGSLSRVLPSAALQSDALSYAKGEPQVTSTSDAGPGSLRQAIKDAKAGQTITFSLKKHAKITLKTGAIVLAKSITITGPGASLLSISGNGKSQLFTISAHTKVTISGLSLVKGKATAGGAISNAGTLKLVSDTLSANQTRGAAHAVIPETRRLHFDVRPRARGGRAVKAPRPPQIPRPSTDIDEAGGAIYNSGTLVVTNSVLSDNNVQQASGGSIYNAQGARLTVSNSTFTKNEGARGGAIYNAGVALLSNDAFKTNKGWPGSGAPISDGFGYGSAVYVDGNTTIEHCTFSGNVAGGDNEGSIGVGGAIAQYSGALAITGSSFTSNVAGGGSHGSWGTGGAIYTTSGDLDLTGNTFSKNQAGGDAFGYGGALYADQMIAGSGNSFWANVALGGAADGYSYGGAIYAGNAIALNGDSFTDNSAQSGLSGESFGGALDSESAANLTSVKFSANTATAGNGGAAQGGAVYLGGGTSKWISVTLSSNQAVSSGSQSYAAGGAVASFSQLSVAGTTTVSGNVATTSTAGAIAAQGGGFAIEVGPFSFIGSITGNTATTQGGGLWIDDSAIISNASVTSNKVAAVQNPNDGGGGIYVSLGGALTMTKSTLAMNSTAGAASFTGGGGLFNAASGTLSNVTISKNSSSVDGGGVENAGVGAFVLTNVTIYQNAASGGGGNVKNLYSDATMSLASSIVGGGSAATGPDISNVGTITSGDYNLVQTTVAGNALAGITTHNLTDDPKLAALGNNGGPTQTNADSATSPGTAYIPFTVCQAAGVTVDQRSDPRNPKGLGRCDIGAFENQSP